MFVFTGELKNFKYMLWLNFLHFYQPANSPSYRIQEAVDKSYLRLVNLLKENPKLKFTANISACLLERLKEEGYTDVLESFSRFVKSGQLELVGSAAYHSFLPFLPNEEIKYQIKRQEEITQEILGIDLRGGGFFFPEMAYTPKLAKMIKDLGYTWTIVDEASIMSANYEAAVIDANSGLKALIRNRAFSNAYAPDLVNSELNNNLPKLMVTATDSELYGLRHEDPTGELEKMIKLSFLESNTISEFLAQQKDLKKVKLLAASWETNQKLDGRHPFIIWRNPKNRIQKDLWRLADLAIKAGQEFKEDNNYYWYRWHLNRGLASCMFWWASGTDFSHNFGPIAWNPDEVEAGLNDLLKAVRSLDDTESRAYKLKTEKIANRIKRLLWQEHWRKYWHNNSQSN